MEYDPEHAEFNQTNTIKQLIETVEQYQRDYAIRNYIRSIPLPPHWEHHPKYLHMFLTANVCHHFLHNLPYNYQDYILKYMDDLGLHQYTLLFQMRGASIFLFTH